MLHRSNDAGALARSGETPLDYIRLHMATLCARIGIRFMVDLDKPQFTMAQVARATPVNTNTIFSWFQRGHFALGKNDKHADLGLAHAISFRTALQVGVAVELYQRCKLHPAIGAKLAREFTHLGDEHRDPGEVFSKDFTVLVAFPELERAKVVRMTSKTPMTEAFMADEYGRQNAATLVWVNFIDRDMRVALLQDGKGRMS